MEKCSRTLQEQRHEQLKFRLYGVLQNQGVQRRSLRKLQPTSLPTPKVDMHSIAQLSSSEMFVFLIEGILRYKTVEKRSAADRILASIFLLADCLVDTLPGNDKSVQFVSETREFLERENQVLAKDIRRVMETAENRAIKRGELLRRWQANQRSIR